MSSIATGDDRALIERFLEMMAAEAGDTEAMGWIEPSRGQDMVWMRLARPGDVDAVTALQGIAAIPRIDALLSDVMLPGQNGFEVARLIRQRSPHIRILFMSGYAEEQLRRSIDLENVAFIPKPFSVQQLAEAARDALGQPD